MIENKSLLTQTAQAQGIEPCGSTPTKSGRGSLVAQLRAELSRRISDGHYQIDERLPSEAKLTEEFGVSRTVVREAVAALRGDGVLFSRQGAGVYVLQPPSAALPPFSELNPDKVSSLIEMLELRMAVEGDAAGYAALRKSAQQEERIIEALSTLRSQTKAQLPTADADFDFHLAIAEAAQNPRFPEFLKLIGPDLIPRHAMRTTTDPKLSAEYAQTIDNEHENIVTAILACDETGARTAMRLHLKNSQIRYRNLTRQATRLP